MIGRSLRLQMTVAITLIEVVMLSLLLFGTLNLLSESYKEHLADSATNIAEQYAATAARYLFEADIPSLNEYTQQVARQEELISVEVFDVSGRSILQYSEADPPPADETFSEEVAISLAGQHVGDAKLGFSLELLSETISEARRRGILIASVEVALTLLVGFYIASRLTAGLRSLSNAAERYGSGDTDVQADVSSTNEIGTTANAFNQMILDRKSADNQLRRSEARFRALVENSEELILVLSEDHSVQYASPSIQTILGHPASHVLGKDISYVFGDAAALAIRGLLNGLVDTRRGTTRQEFCARDAEGQDVFLEMICENCLHDPDVNGIVLNCWDVTERKNVEDQLRQSSKMEAVGNLTGGLAHDFNNLLAVIIGNLDLLREGEKRPKHLGFLDAAMNAAERGTDMTKSMLSFARQSPLEPDNLDLNDLVQEINTWSSRVIPENIELNVHLTPGIWKVRADASMAQNALLNLFLNARDSMPNGGKLSVETENRRIDEDYVQTHAEDLEPGQYVMLCVSDTGGGIPEDILDRIFDPFFTTKPAGSGSGLGLSMIQGFMRQSGGAVRVYSELGVGTTFKLFFRAIDEVQTEQPELPEYDEQKLIEDARILLVEDEPEVLNVLTEMLGRAGLETETASSGDQAYERFRKNDAFDVLVTDVVMPGRMQGFELAKALRQHRPGLPVIFMSGYAKEAAIHENGLGPSDHRLMKPIRRKELIDVIKDALAQSRHLAEVEADALPPVKDPETD